MFDRAEVTENKTSSQFATGTYQVGLVLPGTKEGRVIRTGKTDKTELVISLPAGAKVYVKETYPNDNWAKVEYKANNKTYSGYMYIADKAGMQEFKPIDKSDITPKAITTVPSVTATTVDVAVGKSVSIKWNTVTNATKYTVTIKKDGSTVATKDIAGTTYSHIFNDEGTYSLTVQAKNDAFWSNASSAVAVHAYSPVTVLFQDYDGSPISKQTIDYGDSAKAPGITNGREGYTFRGWDKNYQNVKADTVVTAEYDINTYKVRFFDGNGKQIGTTQTVEYKSGAKAPASDFDFYCKLKDAIIYEGLTVDYPQYDIGNSDMK